MTTEWMGRAALLAALAAGPADLAAQEAAGVPEISPAVLEFLAHVARDAVLDPGAIVDCTLSGGATTKCVRFVLQPAPAQTPGPWCPKTISDGPEAAGFWIKDGTVYPADGAFVKGLASLYGDPVWQLYDAETGRVKATTTFQGCFAAARPDVPRAYYNFCAECTPEQAIAAPNTTFFIPIMPVSQPEPEPIRDLPGAGVALDGVRLNGPAPYDAIVRAYNIAPFDDCGGHVNPYHGYHYHFVTDCLDRHDLSHAPAHAPMVGLSMDGFGIFRRLDALGTEPAGLDACGGHREEGIGYHYHASPVGTNAIIGCLTAQLGCVEEGGAQTCDATGRPPPPPRVTFPANVQPLPPLTAAN